MRALRVLLAATTLVVAAGCLPIAPAPSTPQPTVGTRVAVYGDSVALTLGWYGGEGLLNRATYVGGPQRLGCGIGRGGLRFHQGQVGSLAECDSIYQEWRDSTLALDPDVAVVVAGPWDQLLRLVPGDTQWRNLGDPVYDRWLLGEMLHATDTLLAAGVRHVVWVVPGPMYIGEHSTEEAIRRAEAWRGLIGWVRTLRDGRVTVADQWAWSALRGEDGLVRPDRVHYSPDGAVHTWRGLLGNIVTGV